MQLMGIEISKQANEIIINAVIFTIDSLFPVN